MEIIYADSLFFLNLVINYLILLASARICSMRLRRLRYALAAAVGGVYSVLVLIPAFGFLAVPVMKAALSVVMALIAYGGEKRFLRSVIVFYAVSAAFGGAVYAASMIGGESTSGGLLTPVSLRVLVMAFAICYAAVSLVFRRSGERAARTIHSVEVEFLGRLCQMSALRDTGNTLHDPVSGRAVMVVEASSLGNLLPENILAALAAGGPATALEAAGSSPHLAARLRLVPYTAVGVNGGLLLAFRPDRITVDGKPRADLLVAVSPTVLCEDGEYAAVV